MLLDGRRHLTCLALAVSYDGAEVVTAAGLGDGDVLVAVGHGASTRAGVGLLLGQPDLRRVLVPLGNTGLAVLAPAGSWRLQGWNLPPSALSELLGRRHVPSAAVT